MIKVDKQKDSKNKEKIDITKSTQNLIYLISPLNASMQGQMLNVAKSYDIDKVQAIYETQMDQTVKKAFLKTSYNVFKDIKNGIVAYRSPYTNKYFPSLPNNDGVLPSPFLRSIEEKGQLLFQEYARMYYSEDCISNFFVQEAADQLCFVFYAQNRYIEQKSQGIWSSTNVANISGDSTKSLSYKITTSVIYEVTNFIDSDQSRPFTLSGNLKRVKTESKKPSSDLQLDQLHLTVVGKAIEDNETYLRQQIEEVFCRKTKQIMFKTRVLETKSKVEQQRKILKQLMSSNLVKKQNAIQF